MRIGASAVSTWRVLNQVHQDFLDMEPSHACVGKIGEFDFTGWWTRVASVIEHIATTGRWARLKRNSTLLASNWPSQRLLRSALRRVALLIDDGQQFLLFLGRMTLRRMIRAAEKQVTDALIA